MARHTAASQRARRLADLIQRELSMLLFQAQSGVRAPGTTITDVEVTRDLSWATILVTQLDSDATQVENQLNQQASQWRKALAPALSSLHKIPNIRFKYDRRVEEALHIQQIIAAAIAKTEESEAKQTQSTPKHDEHNV